LRAIPSGARTPKHNLSGSGRSLLKVDTMKDELTRLLTIQQLRDRHKFSRWGYVEWGEGSKEHVGKKTHLRNIIAVASLIIAASNFILIMYTLLTTPGCDPSAYSYRFCQFPYVEPYAYNGVVWLLLFFYTILTNGDRENGI
jgi:hypothetical protein